MVCEKSSSPVGKCRRGHRRNVSDTSANAISLPGHQSAFRFVVTADVILLYFCCIFDSIQVTLL